MSQKTFYYTCGTEFKYERKSVEEIKSISLFSEQVMLMNCAMEQKHFFTKSLSHFIISHLVSRGNEKQKLLIKCRNETNLKSHVGFFYFPRSITVFICFQLTVYCILQLINNYELGKCFLILHKPVPGRW